QDLVDVRDGAVIANRAIRPVRYKTPSGNELPHLVHRWHPASCGEPSNLASLAVREGVREHEQPVVATSSYFLERVVQGVPIPRPHATPPPPERLPRPPSLAPLRDEACRLARGTKTREPRKARHICGKKPGALSRHEKVLANSRRALDQSWDAI